MSLNSVHSLMLCAGILVVLYGFTVEFARFADCVPPFKLTASLKVVNLGLTSSWLAIADLLLASRFDLLRIRVCGGKRQVTGHIVCTIVISFGREKGNLTLFVFLHSCCHQWPQTSLQRVFGSP